MPGNVTHGINTATADTGRRATLAIALVGSFAGPDARGCPVCSTEAGRQERAAIVDGHFGANLVVTAVPFLLCAAVVLAIHGGWPGPRWRRSQRSESIE